MLKRYKGKIQPRVHNIVFLIYHVLTQSPKRLSYSVITLGVLSEIKKKKRL